MAFFKKLFEKKECDLCGGEIGLLGNRKLEDGNCCKECARKLSPWFDERRHSTVEQIRRQLDAREVNRLKLQSWNHKLSFGEHQKIYIQFDGDVPESFVISSASDYKQDNADIIPLHLVQSCDVDIRESHRELKQKNAEGQEVSYVPPRFEYSYNFYIKLMVTGFEYLDDMQMRVNRYTLNLETTRGRTGRAVSLNQTFDPMHYPEYREYRAMCDTIAQIIACGQRGIPYQIQNSPIAPVTSTQIPRQPIVQPAAQTAWRCPSCGTENNGKFCAGCGSMRSMPAPNGWKCFCGTVNTGKFCTECGTIQFNLKSIECSECSWTAEPGDTVIPTFCPNCGRRFNADDI